MFIFLVRKIYLFIIEFDREKIRQLDYIYIYIFFCIFVFLTRLISFLHFFFLLIAQYARDI